MRQLMRSLMCRDVAAGLSALIFKLAKCHRKSYLGFTFLLLRVKKMCLIG